MAKVKSSKNSYETIVNALAKHLASRPTNTLSQQEVFDFLEKKKILVSEEGAEELLEKLIEEGIVEDETDSSDLEDVSAEGIGQESGIDVDSVNEDEEQITLQEFDETQEIVLTDIDERQDTLDSELENKLTETDDIVK